MVYCGTASGVYDQQAEANDQTSQTILHLAVGARYYFAVTAYNQDGVESDYSDEISCTIPRPGSTPTPTPTPTPTANPNADAYSDANAN